MKRKNHWITPIIAYPVQIDFCKASFWNQWALEFEKPYIQAA